jgi:Cytochrome P450
LMGMFYRRESVTIPLESTRSQVAVIDLFQTIVSTNPVAASLFTANFESPFDFRPERWLQTNGKDVLEACQPFSLGARGCLGRKYVTRSNHCAP